VSKSTMLTSHSARPIHLVFNIGGEPGIQQGGASSSKKVQKSICQVL
jgi:hypothetical protein